jgi:hypothetical protein
MEGFTLLIVSMVFVPGPRPGGHRTPLRYRQAEVLERLGQLV